MIVLAFISWWYGKGWREAYKRTLGFISGIGETFSVSLLLKTLLSPWRRITAVEGTGLEAHFRALIDNTISRLVGLCVRSAVLLAALTSLLLVAVFGSLQIILWPLLPPAILALIILGIV